MQTCGWQSLSNDSKYQFSFTLRIISTLICVTSYFNLQQVLVAIGLAKRNFLISGKADIFESDVFRRITGIMKQV